MLPEYADILRSLAKGNHLTHQDFQKLGTIQESYKSTTKNIDYLTHIFQRRDDSKRIKKSLILQIFTFIIIVLNFSLIKLQSYSRCM